MGLKFYMSFLSLLIVTILVKLGLCLTNEEEKAALQKFRGMIDVNLLSADYMKTDEYLLKWLQASNFNLNEAISKLEMNVEWRKVNKIDGILNETNLACDKLLPTNTDSVDKLGRPAAFQIINDWAIRKLSVGGKLPEFERCMVQLYENMVRKSYMELNRTENKNDKAQYVFVVDMNAFNARQHTCVACITTYFNIIRAYETYYPLSVGKVTLVNTPELLRTILEILKPAMSPISRSIMNLYGYDKASWQTVLTKDFELDQLPKRFGGTKDNNLG